MTPMLEIGEMLLSETERKRDYFFRPSLKNIASIGSPKEIVEVYAILNGSEFQSLSGSSYFPERLIYSYSQNLLSCAIKVMSACCSEDISDLVGEFKGWKHCYVYRPGLLTKFEIITYATSLIEHGVIGKAKVRKLQKNEGRNDFTNEFYAMEYINAARIHFSMPRAEAEQLTMTEFQLLLKAKYPEEKGFTREEYDAIMDADDQLQEKLIAQEAARLAKNGG